MFRKNKDEKVFRYSIRKYHFGAASVAVAALMFLGVRAEVVKANTSLDVAQATLGSSDSATGQSDEASRAVASTPVSAPTTASSETTPAEAETSATKVDKTKLQANYDKLLKLLPESGLQGEALENAKTLATKVQVVLADDSASAEAVEKAEKVLEEVLVAIENAQAKKAEETKSASTSSEVAKAEPVAEKQATAETGTPAVAEEAEKTEAKAKLQVSLERLEQAITQTPDHDLTRDILEKALAQVTLAKAVLGNTEVSLREIEDMNRAVKKSEGSVMIARNRLTSGRNDARNGKKMAEGVQFRAEVANSYQDTANNGNILYIATQMRGATDPASAKQIVSDSIQYKTRFNKNSNGKIISVDWMVYFNNHVKNFSNEYGVAGELYENYFQVPNEVNMPQNIQRVQYKVVQKLRGGRFRRIEPNGNPLSNEVTFDNPNPNTAVGGVELQKNENLTRDSWSSYSRGYANLYANRNRVYNDAYSKVPETKKHIENSAINAERVIWDDSNTAGNWKDAYIWRFTTTVPDRTTNEQLKNMKIVFGMYRKNTVGNYSGVHAIAANPVNLSAADVAKDFTPVKPADKLPVATPGALSQKEQNDLKAKVQAANPGKTVVVDPSGKATVTDPATGISHEIPSSDLVVKDFTPVKPADKLPVATPGALSQKEQNDLKAKVQAANPGKTVVVDPSGKATVTDPATGISHEIPSSDLVVKDFTPVKPADKLPVATPGALSQKEQNDLKAKVQAANPGKTVVVDPSGKATVTDPATGISHEIPSSDLVVKDFTPVKPADKLPVATPGALSQKEQNDLKAKVQAANPGKTVVVDPSGKATVTDPATGISHEIPSSDLVVKDFTPVKPADKLPVATPGALSQKEQNDLKAKVQAANPGKTVVVDPSGKATVTDPATGISHEIPSSDLVVKDFTPVKPADKLPVATPGALSQKEQNDLKAKVQAANPGKTVVVDPSGKATVTDPATGISHEIPSSDLVVKDFTPVKPADKLPVATPGALSQKEQNDLKAKVQAANPGKTVVVDPSGKATVTDPATGISHEIPSSDLVVKDFTPVKPADKLPVATPGALSQKEQNDLKAKVQAANPGKTVVVDPSGKATVTDPATGISHEIPSSDLVVKDFTPVKPADKLPVATPGALSQKEQNDLKAKVQAANPGKTVVVDPSGKATVTDPATGISHEIPSSDLVVKDFTPVKPADKLPVATPGALSQKEQNDLKAKVQAANPGKTVVVDPSGKATVTDPATGISHEIPSSDLVVKDFTPVKPADKLPVATPGALSQKEQNDLKAKVQAANPGKTVVVDPSGKATVTDPATGISHEIPSSDLVVKDFTPVKPADKLPVATPGALSQKEQNDLKAKVQAANPGKTVVVDPSGKATVTDPATGISHEIPSSDLVVKDFTPVKPADKLPVATPGALSQKEQNDLKAKVQAANPGKTVVVDPSGKATVTDPATGISHEIPSSDLVVKDFTPVKPADKLPVATPGALSQKEQNDLKAKVQAANPGKTVVVDPSGKATVTDPATGISHEIPSSDLVVKDFTPVKPADKLPVATPGALSQKEQNDLKAKVQAANPGKTVVVDPSGKATVTDPATGISHEIPSSDLVVKDFTPVKPADKLPVATPGALSQKEQNDLKAKVQAANPGKTVVVDPSGKATVTDPATGISHEIPSSDLVVKDFTPVKPADKLPVATPGALSQKEQNDLKAKVQAANPGKTVVVDPSGKATVTDPATGISHEIPSSDLVVKDFTPVKPADKLPVATPGALSQKEQNDLKAKVQAANPGKTVVVDPSGKATVTDPATGISHEIPSSDLVVKDFTPVKPADKLPVATPGALSQKEQNDLKAKVQAANPGKTVVVDPSGKATVTDPATGISHEIPSSDLVVKDFTPVKPADKLPVATPGALSQKEQNDLKAKVQAANPGKTVVVDPSGKATVTDPATGISHEIPSSDLVVKDFTPVKPADKLPVATPGALSQKEQNDLKAKVQAANPGKTVVVDPSGKATVTDPATGISHEIPSSDLVVKDFTPVKPADKLPVATPGALSQKEQNDLKAKVQAANPGKTVVVDPSGKATVTDPATGISHEIPSSDLVVKDFTPVKPADKLPVATPGALSQKEQNDLKAKVQAANPGKTVVVDPSGKATVTDPATGISHEIPSSDLVVKDFTPVKPADKLPVATPGALSQKEQNDLKAKVQAANPGKTVVVDPSGKATVTDPATGISHEIPSSDLVVKDFTPVKPADKLPVATPGALSQKEQNDLKAKVQAANPGKTVVVDPSGKATVTDPATGISHEIPSSDLVVKDFTPVKPADKLPVATPGALSQKEQNDLKAKVQAANPGKTVVVDPSGKATVTDPATGISHEIPSSDLVVKDFTPVKPADKLPVATPGALSQKEQNDLKAKVQAANPGKTVVVDPSGKATVTDPATGISHEIPSSDLVVKDFTPVKPADKLPVATPGALSQKEQNDLKAKVQAANPGKTVVVDPSGKATVTDPATGISHEIPSSDLVVKDFTPVKPADKLPVATPGALSQKEQNDLKAKVQAANPGKTVVVDPSGKATVTDPATGISHEIPSSDLVVKDFTPVKPADKLPVATPGALSQKEQNDLKAKVQAANPGKTVVVDPSGKATVTDPATGISHEIPSSDLVVKDFTPVKPADKLPVATPGALSQKEQNDLKAKVQAANPGKTVVVDPSGKATVTDPATGISHEIPSSDLVVKDFTPVKPADKLPVATPGALSQKEQNDLKAKVQAANPGKTVVVDPSGKATVTDPATGISHEIPSSDLVVKDFTPVKPADKLPVATPGALSQKEQNDLKAKVQAANPGKTVVVDPSGKATVTDPATGISHEIPSSDLVVKDFTPVKPADKLPVATPGALSQKEQNDLKAKVQAANPGKTVVVDPSGKATVTDPATGISHEIPSSDLVVKDFTPVKPADKLPVATPGALSQKEQNDLKAKVQAANPGKTVVVDPSGKATVTDPATGISHEIPSSDLVVKDFTPVKPADKLPVATPGALSQKEQNDLKAKVQAANPGKTVVVDPSGKATVTDPATGISHEIPSSDLVVKDFTPVKPADKLPVATPGALSQKEQNDLKAKVQAANPGKTVVVDPSGKATVTDPATGISHEIPSSDLVVKDFTPVKPADKLPVATPGALSQKEQNDLKAKVQAANPGKTVVVDPSGKATVTDPATGISHEIPSSDLVVKDFTPVKPADKLPVATPGALSQKEQNDLKAKVQAANPGKTVVVDPSGKATVTDPATGISHEIPSSDLVEKAKEETPVTPVKPVTPAKTEVKDPEHLTDKEKEAVKDKVEKANPGKNVTVDDQGNATVTDPTNGSSATIPSSDLVEKAKEETPVTPVKPVTPAKTEVKDPEHLTDKEKEAVKDKVEKANPGKNVTVDDQGNATVTDPTNGSSATIPSSDLVEKAKEETPVTPVKPVTPAKTEVKDPEHLTDKEKEAVKDKVEKANPGKNVTVDDQGNATVTDPTNGSSATIPSSDLVEKAKEETPVTPVKPVTPAKTEVKDPEHLTDKEKEAVKDKVEKANPGKNVTVDDQGNATVTDPTNGSSATIPSSDLVEKAKEETPVTPVKPVTPAKTEVKDPEHLTDKEKEAVKDKVEKANPGKNVTVDDQGNATVTDPTNGSSATIPSSDLVEKAKEETPVTPVKPVTPAKTEVKDPEHLTDKEKEAVKDKVEKANPGKNVTVDDQGNATVTDPTNGSSATIPSSDLVEKAKEETPVTPVKPVTPAKTEVKDPEHLTDKEKEAVKDKVEKANPGKNVTVDDQGNATVTDPTNGSSATIPSSDLVEKAKEETPVTPVKPVTPAKTEVKDPEHLTDKEKEAVKDKVEKANPGKNVTVDDQGNATVTDPTNGSSATIPSSDLVEKAKEETPVTPVKPVTPAKTEVKDPEHLTDKEKEAVKDKVEKANPGKNVTVDDQGNATVTDPTNGSSATIPSSDLVEKAKEETPVTPVKPVTPAKTEVKDPEHLTDKEKEAVKDKVEKANPGKNVTVDDQGNATVTDPTNGSSATIPSSDLVEKAKEETPVTPVKPVTPAKTEVKDPEHLTDKEKEAVKDKVEKANPGKNVTVDDQGNATVTDPTNGSSATIPSSDLVEKAKEETPVTPVKPVTPAKTEVKDPEHLTDKEKEAVKDKVEKANPGKNVTVDDQGNATVTDPTNGSSATIPSSDLVEKAKEETPVTPVKPVTPAKTEVKDPEHLTDKEKEAVKDKVEKANPGKNVTVDDQGNATVTDPTNGSSATIPSSDLVEKAKEETPVTPVKPVTPAKTEVKDPEHLTDKEKEAVKDKVEKANPGKNVTVDDQGNATVTDPTNGSSATIPSSDLVEKAKEETPVTPVKPVTPAKTEVKDPEHLTDKEKEAVKDKVEKANPGKNVTVDDQGNATVTDPTNGSSATIPSSDLVEKAKEETPVTPVKPVTPAKTEVKDPEHLTDKEKEAVKDKVEKANPGKNVTVDDQGNATVTDPTNGSSATIPSSDLVEKAKEETPVTPVKPVTPAKTEVKDPEHLTDKEKEAVKDKVEKANPGKNVTVDDQGNATVTDPTNGSSATIPSSDLVEKAKEETPVTPVKPVTPAKTEVKDPEHLTDKEKEAVKDKVEKANPGKNVTVDDQGNATVTDPTNGSSATIPSSDLVEKAKEETPVTPVKPVTPAKTEVKDPEHLTDKEKEAVKDKVEKANPGKNVTVDDQGNATVTDPTNGSSATIPSSDLVEKAKEETPVTPVKPVTPAKTEVKDPEHLTDKEKEAVKDKVEKANPGKNVTVDDQGNATVTDPTNGSSATIPSSDLVEKAKEETPVTPVKPVTPAKTEVKDPEHLTDKEKEAVKDKVEKANPGKNVTVDDQGNATVTDPTNGSSATIPSSDLVEKAKEETPVTPVKPVTPAKTEVKDPEHLTDKEKEAVKDKVEKANPGKNVTVDDQGNATVTDPTNGSSATIPSSDLVEKAKEETPVTPVKPVTPAKTEVKDPEHLTDKEKEAVKDKVEKANPGKNVTVDDQGNATVTDPTNGSSATIPSSDLVEKAKEETPVTPVKPVTPAKTEVKDPEHLTDKEKEAVKDKVEKANPGKNVTVDDQGNATVTDPTNGSSATIPSSDLVEKAKEETPVTPVKPVTPAKTEVKDPEHLTDKEKEAVKDKVEKANPGKNVTVDDQGNATVTDPTNGSSATIPSSDLVEKAKEETPVTPVKPVTPAKTEVKDPEHLTDKEKEAVKDKVEKANPGKNVTVDDQGNATVTDPTNGSSATIPSSDLVEKAKEETPVTPVKPVTPAKTEVKDPEHLTDKEKEAVKDKVEKANPGKNVTVDDQGNATVTDPTNGSSATIPSSDLVEKAKEETPVTPVKPVTPAKTEVKDPEHLTDKEKEAVKDKVEKANPGKNVTVDDQGNATVTDPTNGSSATIPSSDLVEKAKEETPVTPVKPVTPAKTEVKDPEHLTDKEKEAVKDKVEKANPGKNVTVDDQGNATVTDPTNGSSATIPSSDLVEKAKEETPVTPVKPVTPAKTEVKDPEHLTDKEKEAVKDKVEKANPGKNVTVDDQGNATVTDPTNGSSATIPSSDLVEKAKEETPVTPVKPVTPAKTEVKDPEHLTDKEKEAVKDKVEKANPGKNVTVDDQGNATVTDPTNGSSATIPSSDLVEKAKEETPVTPVKPVTPAKTEVKDPEHLTDKEKEAVKDKVEKANPGKNVTVDDQGNATVTDPTNGSSATIPSSDLVEKAKEETPVTPVKPVTPAKTEVKDPEHLTDKEKEAVKDKVEKANPGKNVTVDDQGNATVTDPTNGSSATIPSSDLVEKAKEETPVTPVKPVTPAKTEVKDPEHLTDKEKEAVKDKVEKANPGKNVTVDDQGNATVTDPTNGSSATIPSSDLVEKAKEETPVTPVKPVTPAKTEVKDPEHLTDKEKEAVKDKVEKANPGKNVTVDDQGNATVTDPTNGSSATIPSSDLVEKAKEETPVTPVKPVTPAKTEVKDPEHLTDKEKEAVKDKVEKANPGKNVTVDDQGNATVTDPTNGSSATIPSSDLVEKAKEETPVTPVKPVTPAKTEVKDPEHLTDKEKEAVKDKVEKANPGKNVTVDDQGNATVTDPTNGSSATIPSSDLVEKAKEETPVTPVKPVTPAKTEVKDPEHLTDKEKEAVKDKVEKANPGKNVTVDDQGNATVTDPTNGSSATIPSSDLVEKAKEETPVTPVKPVTPAKTEVKDPEHLTDKEKEAVKDKVEKANPGKNVTVDDQGNATVTDPTNGSSATIPSSDLVEKAKEETPVTPVKPVTPAKTEVKDPEHLTDKEKEAVKDKVEKANPGKNVTVDDQGNATVTDPTNGSSATIPSSDLVEKAKEETPVTPVKPVTPAKTEVKDPEHLTDKEKEAVKDKVEKANPGKNVTVDDQGNATVTDPTNGSSATIPSSDLVEKAKEETPVTPVKPVTPAKTEVKDPEHLTDKEKEAVKDKVEKANPGKNVTVDDQGNATVTDPTNGSSATIPSSDLVEKAKEETPVTPVKPVTPAKTEVKDPEHLTDKEKEAVKDKVEKANPGKNVTVDDQGNATVTDPTNGSSATIPSSDLVEKAKEETPVTPVKPVTPANDQATAQTNTRRAAKELPNTGTADSAVSMVAAAASALIGLGLAGRRRKEDEE